MTSRELKVGTRGSLLALTQTRQFVAALLAIVPEVSVSEVTITTQGDTFTQPLSTSKTPGLFVGALREALLLGQVDFIVHSMKDLPAVDHPQLSIACVPTREDARDCLVSRNGIPLEDLPTGAVIGTSSPRRAATVRSLRPDLEIRDIRGNIDTRIAKVKNGDYDATVLALAGLKRAGLETEACQIFESDSFVPAASQGALAVECRADDTELIEILSRLDDLEARIATTAERAVLEGISAGCSTAIGVSATIEGSVLHLVAELSAAETSDTLRIESFGHLGKLAECEAAKVAARTQGLGLASRLRTDEIAAKAAWN